MKVFQLFALLLSPYIANAFVGSPALTKRHLVGASLSVNTVPLGLTSRPEKSIWTTPTLFATPDDKEEISAEDENAAAREYLTSLGDGTDIDAVMSALAEMEARPAPVVSDMLSIQSRGCATDIAIDVIALALDVGGIPGGKSVAGKLFDNLPKMAQKRIIQIIKTIDASSFAGSVWDILQILYNELSWNAIKNSFSDFGLWESIKLGTSLIALFVSGGVAFIINLALRTIAITELIIAISQCDEF